MSTIKLTLTSAHRLLPAGCDQWLTNLSGGHCWGENMAVRDEWLAVLDSTRSACKSFISVHRPLSHDLRMRRCRITSSHPPVTFSLTSLLRHHPHPAGFFFYSLDFRRVAIMIFFLSDVSESPRDVLELPESYRLLLLLLLLCVGLCVCVCSVIGCFFIKMYSSLPWQNNSDKTFLQSFGSLLSKMQRKRWASACKHVNIFVYRWLASTHAWEQGECNRVIASLLLVLHLRSCAVRILTLGNYFLFQT